MENHDSTVDAIFTLYAGAASAPYIGEPISQLEHALQAAALARQAGASDHVVIAALLHDIGHLDLGNADFSHKMDGYGVARHEEIGARFVREQGFPEEIAELILGHVEAKRFLVHKYPSYLSSLSAASLETLKRQGGPMNAEEAARFESNPLHKDKLRLRAWDDQAKLENHPVPGLETYRQTLLGTLSVERERR